MKSHASPGFWDRYEKLPPEIREIADKNFALWRSNPRHPSLHFKPIGNQFWSARVGLHHRAVGRFQDDDSFLWFWIGTHADYDRH